MLCYSIPNCQRINEKLLRHLRKECRAHISRAPACVCFVLYQDSLRRILSFAVARGMAFDFLQGPLESLAIENYADDAVRHILHRAQCKGVPYWTWGHQCCYARYPGERYMNVCADLHGYVRRFRLGFAWANLADMLQRNTITFFFGLCAGRPPAI